MAEEEGPTNNESQQQQPQQPQSTQQPQTQQYVVQNQQQMQQQPIQYQQQQQIQYQQQPMQPNMQQMQQQPIQYQQQPNMQPVQYQYVQQQQQPQVIVYTPDPNNPDKLSIFDYIQQIYIKQPIRIKEQFLEQCCGWNYPNYYELIFGNDLKNGPPAFVIKEESNCCLRQYCQQSRPFKLHALLPNMTDPNSHKRDDFDPTQSIFIIDSPYRFGWCCCPATSILGLSYMDVMIGNTMIGSIREEFKVCGYIYGVWNSNNELLCKVERTGCCRATFLFGFNVEFDITQNEADTGKRITKIWAGFGKELFTDCDNFLVEFPESICNVRENKILLIAAAMMVEYKHFESSKKKNDKRRHNHLNMNRVMY